MKLFSLLFAFVAFQSQALALDIPSYRDRVNDFSGTLTASQVQQLNTKVHQTESQSKVQIAIAVFPSLGDADLEGFTNDLFHKWGVGEKDKNNGVLLTVFLAEHKMRMESGYGVEGVFTDALTQRIQVEELRPHFRTNDLLGGLNAYIDRVVQISSKAAAVEAVATPVSTQDTGWPTYTWVLLALLTVVVIGSLFWFANYYNKQQLEADEAEEKANELIRQEEVRRAARESETLRQNRPVTHSHITADTVAATAAGVSVSESAARRKREDNLAEEERRAKKKRDEESSYSSNHSSYDSSSSYSSPSSFDSGSSFGGGDSGGGGASSSW